VLLKEPNAKIELLAAALVVAMGYRLSISTLEWAVLALSCSLVLCAEALNTALEHVVDIASPQWSMLARQSKDVAAAAVLISSIGATCVGAFVFIPKL